VTKQRVAQATNLLLATPVCCCCSSAAAAAAAAAELTSSIKCLYPPKSFIPLPHPVLTAHRSPTLAALEIAIVMQPPSPVANSTPPPAAATVQEGSREAAPSASSALVEVHSLSSLEQELFSISDPVDDVIDLGRWSDGPAGLKEERAGFKAWTLDGLRLLAVKLHSNQNVKVLNLVGNEIGAEGAGMLVEPLGKLTALQELNFSGTF